MNLRNTLIIAFVIVAAFALWLFLNMHQSKPLTPAPQPVDYQHSPTPPVENPIQPGKG